MHENRGFLFKRLFIPNMSQIYQRVEEEKAGHRVCPGAYVLLVRMHVKYLQHTCTLTSSVAGSQYKTHVALFFLLLYSRIDRLYTLPMFRRENNIISR